MNCFVPGFAYLTLVDIEQPATAEALATVQFRRVSADYRDRDSRRRPGVRTG
jgi:hypothetical protein